MQTSSQLPENVPMHISTLHILDSEYFQILIFSAPDPKVQKRIKSIQDKLRVLHACKKTHTRACHVYDCLVQSALSHSTSWFDTSPSSLDGPVAARAHAARKRPPPKTPCCPKVSPRKMKAISVAQSGCEA